MAGMGWEAALVVFFAKQGVNILWPHTFELPV